jgi:uncharacterized Zn finger protein (UPF0148 family)
MEPIDKPDKPDKQTDIKNAAALLLKGGSLLSEPCRICGGLQVKFKDGTTCVNCGNKQIMSKRIDRSDKEYDTVNKPGHSQIELESTEFIIKDKVLMLSKEIKDERELTIEKQKADLIEVYLRILQSIKVLKNKSDL